MAAPQAKQPEKFKPDGSLAGFHLQTGRPVARQIHDWLRARIIAGHIKPGRMPGEAGLCRWFGVSRQPVREALQHLSMQSLVQIYPQRGSRVARISVPMVLRAQLVREAVEVEAITRAIERGDAALPGALETELKLQKTFAAASDFERFFRSDQVFHKTICDQCGVPGVWENLADLRCHLDRARHVELETQMTLEVLIGQHRDIYRAIVRRDAGAARAAMRVHLQRILRQLPQTVASAPGLFEDADITWQDMTGGRKPEQE